MSTFVFFAIDFAEFPLVCIRALTVSNGCPTTTPDSPF